MCTQTLSTFTHCPCRLRRVTLCPPYRHKEENTWEHLEKFWKALELDALLGWVDHRTCKEFESVEEKIDGTCEMKEGGGCLYVEGNLKLDDRIRGEGDMRGWWSGDYDYLLEHNE